MTSGRRASASPRRLAALLAVLATLAAAGWLVSLSVAAFLSRPANGPVEAGRLDALRPEPVAIPSASGSTVHGWRFAGVPGHGSVLLLHGYTANRIQVRARVQPLLRAGYSVLAIDLQAHGESPGERITFGYLESRDVAAAVAWLRARAPAEAVGIDGISLGAAASLLADPPLEVEAIVVESCFASFEDAVGNRIELVAGAWARFLTPFLTMHSRTLLGVPPARLRPADYVGGVRAPILVAGGDHDEHARLGETELLYARAPEPKELWVVPGAAHVDLYRYDEPAWEAHVLAFLDRWVAGRGRPLSASAPVQQLVESASNEAMGGATAGP